MSRGYNHTQPNTWETQNYRRDGGRTVTFAPPQAYVTTKETVVEQVHTRPIIMDYDATQLDDRRRTSDTTRPPVYWQQQRRPASPEDPRRHDDANYGNGHRVRHDGYVSRDNNNYPNRYHYPAEVERIRPLATTDFQPPGQTHGALLTSATNDINTAVNQLRDSAEPKHGAYNYNTGTGTYGFMEHKPKPRFKVSVPHIPRNETVYPDRTHRGAPQTMDKASGRYGGRAPLPPSKLLSTVGDYPINTVDHERAARLYNGELV